MSGSQTTRVWIGQPYRKNSWAKKSGASENPDTPAPLFSLFRMQPNLQVIPRFCLGREN